MKRSWYVIAVIASILSITLSACAQSSPAPTTTTTAPPKTTVVQPTTPTAPSTTTGPAATTPAADKPQYGGTLTAVLTADITNFDSGLNGNTGYLLNQVYQQYMTTDWLKGPAGTNVSNYAPGPGAIEQYYMPQLATSWTMPAPGVWILQIRQGVRWQKADSDAGRLMAGREMTADDIVASYNRLLAAPRSWINVSQAAVAKATTIEKTGPWEVTFKTPVDYLTSFFWIIQGGGFNRVYPPEVTTKYGDVGDWHNAVGTGPFMLTDYTKGSSLTYVKNPNYWETDPVGPGKGNKLPYVDNYREVIIPDVSTRITALRTGKIDIADGTSNPFAGALNSVDALPLIKANPQLQYVKYLSNTPWGITMRTDKQDQPFSKLQVRQALLLATDLNALKQTLFGGDAEIDVWPINKNATVMYQPLSEMPQAVQDLYTYNPTKAKQMLSDAGYPNGFDASIVVSSVDQTKIDDLTAFQAQWAKVGVKLNLDTRDNAVYTSMAQARSNDQMMYRGLVGAFTQQLYFSAVRGPSTNNPSFVDDPIGSVPQIESIFAEVNKNMFVDMPKVYTTYKQLKPFILGQAYYIVRPTPYTYNMWWPWVKNYYGQGVSNGFMRFAWVDQALKKTMGY